MPKRAREMVRKGEWVRVRDGRKWAGRKEESENERRRGQEKKGRKQV